MLNKLILKLAREWSPQYLFAGRNIQHPIKDATVLVDWKDLRIKQLFLECAGATAHSTTEGYGFYHINVTDGIEMDNDH